MWENCSINHSVIGSMNIVIFGASGRTGTELVRQALAQGHRVTAFVRNQARLRHIHHQNLTVVEGDLNNAAQVSSAMRGNHAVISALGVSKTLRHDPEVVRGISVIVNAMEKEKIDRLVYLSVFLAYAKPRQFSFFVHNILRKIIRKEVLDHEQKERLIRERVKAYTMVRACRLTDKPFTGNYHHGETIAIKNFLPSVPRADVAHFMLSQLADTTYLNKPVLLTANP